MLQFPPKTTTDVISDYKFDWTAFDLAETDHLTSAVITVSDSTTPVATPTLIVTGSVILSGNQIVQFTASGGTAGHTYIISCTVTTTINASITRSGKLSVKAAI